MFIKKNIIKLIHLFVLMLCINTTIVFFPKTTQAFFPRGRVSNEFKYKNLKLYPSKYSLHVGGTLTNSTQYYYSLHVGGTLTNSTQYHYSLSVKIYFCDIFGKIYTSGKFFKEIDPYGEVNFYTDLKGDSYGKTKDAHHVSWDVTILSSSKKEEETLSSLNSNNNTQNISIKKPENKKSYSTTRENDSSIYIKGAGTHVTDRFNLPQGPNTFKMKYNGRGNFIVKVFNAKGKLVDTLSNEIGSINLTRNVTIDGADSFFITVRSSGDWNIEILKAKSNQDKEKTPLNVSQESSSNSELSYQGSTNIIIILKNGRKIETDSYQDTGNKIQFIKYGGTISLDKDNIEKIIQE